MVLDCAYPLSNGQAELSWVSGYTSRGGLLGQRQRATHPSTNRARRRYVSQDHRITAKPRRHTTDQNTEKILDVKKLFNNFKNVKNVKT